MARHTSHPHGCLAMHGDEAGRRRDETHLLRLCAQRWAGARSWGARCTGAASRGQTGKRPWHGRPRSGAPFLRTGGVSSRERINSRRTNGSSSSTTRCTPAASARSLLMMDASLMATRLDPVRLTKRMVSRDRWAARPFARRLFRKVAARKARSRAAAARAPGLKADAWASTRSKQVHGAPTSSRVDAASTAELSLDKARTENSHAWMTICGDSFGDSFGQVHPARSVAPILP